MIEVKATQFEMNDGDKTLEPPPICTKEKIIHFEVVCCLRIQKLNAFF